MENTFEKFFKINKEINNIKLSILLTYILSISKDNIAYLIQTFAAKKFGLYISTFRKLMKDAQDNGYITIASLVKPNHFFYSEKDFMTEFGKDAEQFYNVSTVGTQITISDKLIELTQ